MEPRVHAVCIRYTVLKAQTNEIKMVVVLFHMSNGMCVCVSNKVQCTMSILDRVNCRT